MGRNAAADLHEMGEFVLIKAQTADQTDRHRRRFQKRAGTNGETAGNPVRLQDRHGKRQERF